MVDSDFTSYSSLPMQGRTLPVGNYKLSASDIFNYLKNIITKERQENIAKVVNSRTNNFVPVLENIYDRGNINAVMRSAEAFGFYNLQLVSKEGARYKDSNRITKGTHKWLNVSRHQTALSAAQNLRQQGFKIYCTHLKASKNIAEIDFTRKAALVFGNEKEGVSPEMQDLSDGNCIVPMEGFAQSFNISVAAAICFYHVYLQRVQKLGKSGDLSSEQKEWLVANYFLKAFGSLDKFEKLVKKIKEGS